MSENERGQRVRAGGWDFQQPLPRQHAGVTVHATTVLGILRDGELALGADGQVTVGETVMKGGADKVRRVAKGRAVVGFAGGVADALGLLERLEAKLEAHPGNVRRAAVSPSSVAQR